VLIVFSLVVSTSLAQEAIAPRPSPLTALTARYKDTYLKIVYSQPHKRGREVFGQLVPFGQVWRTGANEATEITNYQRYFYKRPASYGRHLFFIHYSGKRENGRIILNKDLGMWGSYNYNPKMDVFRFEVPVQSVTNVVYEPFTILIDQKNNKAEISLLWDKTKVSFPVDFIEPKS